MKLLPEALFKASDTVVVVAVALPVPVDALALKQVFREVVDVILRRVVPAQAAVPLPLQLLPRPVYRAKRKERVDGRNCQAPALHQRPAMLILALRNRRSGDPVGARHDGKLL